MGKARQRSEMAVAGAVCFGHRGRSRGEAWSAGLPEEADGGGGKGTLSVLAEQPGEPDTFVSLFLVQCSDS